MLAEEVFAVFSPVIDYGRVFRCNGNSVPIGLRAVFVVKVEGLRGWYYPLPGKCFFLWNQIVIRVLITEYYALESSCCSFFGLPLCNVFSQAIDDYGRQ